jgi:hypothetical protein
MIVICKCKTIIKRSKVFARAKDFSFIDASGESDLSKFNGRICISQENLTPPRSLSLSKDEMAIVGGKEKMVKEDSKDVQERVALKFLNGNPEFIEGVQLLGKSYAKNNINIFIGLKSKIYKAYGKMYKNAFALHLGLDKDNNSIKLEDELPLNNAEKLEKYLSKNNDKNDCRKILENNHSKKKNKHDDILDSLYKKNNKKKKHKNQYKETDEDKRSPRSFKGFKFKDVKVKKFKF